jgi:hypothetical protein
MSGLNSSLRVATQGDRVTLPLDGLVAYYDPNNSQSYPGAGFDVFDLSGNSYDAYIDSTLSWVQDTPSYWNNVAGGMLYDDDGSPDYIYPNTTAGDHSWTFVLKSNDDGVLGGTRKGNGTQQQGSAEVRLDQIIDANARVNFEIWGNSTPSQTVFGPNTLLTNTWYVVTCTMNWTTRLAKIYYDGIEVESESITLGNPTGYNEQYRIGWLKSSPSQSGLSGQYGAFMLHNRALEANEAYDLFAVFSSIWN